jgi:hypothetical protein
MTTLVNFKGYANVTRNLQNLKLKRREIDTKYFKVVGVNGREAEAKKLWAEGAILREYSIKIMKKYGIGAYADDGLNR